MVVAVVVAVVVIVAAAARSGARPHAGGAGAVDGLQVLAHRPDAAVLADDLHRVVLGVRQVEAPVGDARRELRRDLPGRHLRAQVGLPGQVRAQQQHHREPGRDERARHHRRRADGRPGPDRPRPARHVRRPRPWPAGTRRRAPS
ncbi:Uncharacterised protein [Mycobacterium tuberculosis]|nr:Uncharacterised protein [Mycobacterium tuberculosis]